jgi:hypothetical protein
MLSRKTLVRSQKWSEGTRWRHLGILSGGNMTSG